MSPLHRALTSARRRLDGQEGFSLLEVVFAITVMMVALLALAYTAGIAFSDIQLARQRQGATGLANRAIEETRALPFDTLKKGLASWDLTGDSNITSCGANKCFGGERIPTSGYPVGTSIVPLVPHRQTVVVGPTTYTVKVYVTYYQNQLSANTFTVTAHVSWPNPGRQGVRSEVQTQTIAFSPEGCLSTATHPFAAPCQPFLYGVASTSPATIGITGTIAGLSLEKAALQLPTANSIMQVEQIWAVNGFVTTPGASLKESSEAEVTVGATQVSSGADNDPSQSNAEFQSVPTGPEAGGSLVIDSGQNELRLTVAGADSGQTTSTTSASIVPAKPCRDLLGVDQNDALPCGTSNVLQAGAMSATLIQEKGSADLGPALIAWIDAAPSSLVTHTNRVLLPEATACTGTVGDGCLRTEARRSIGDVALGGLPANLDPAAVPAGWNGYLVYLDGFSDSVMAESGWGSVAPTASVTGTIYYWNGSGYDSLTITAGAGVDLPPVTLHIDDPSFGPAVTVDITADLRTVGTSTTEAMQTCDPACPDTRTSATATSGSPLVGTVTYTVTRGTATVSDLTMAVNLGELVAETNYQSSPSQL